MKRTLIIARHGNTFKPGETPTRVGAKTDLPLVEEERGRSIGRYLKEHQLIPDAVYASPLLRARETARLAVEELGLSLPIIEIADFTEIDYGPDENKTEEEVMLRLGNGHPEKGKAIIDAWNQNATVPEGWDVDPQEIIRTWKNFADHQALLQPVTLLVTSNGILRFAPYLTGNFERFSQENDIKVATGGLCLFEKEEHEPHWHCTAWNIKPYKLYADK